MASNFKLLWQLALVLVTLCEPAMAHDVAEGDKAFVQSMDGPAFIPFLYLGAKHMVTGYDHILFLIGVVFFLTRARDVIITVSLFTLGHSTTLMGGVLLGTRVEPHLVDAVIGLSVVYKGVENLGGFRRMGLVLDTRMAVLVFGLFHGLGLATKLQDLSVHADGLLINLIGFNVGVEIGQVAVLLLVVIWLGLWRQSAAFPRWVVPTNVGLVIAGLLLTGLQIKEYISS